MNRSLQRYNVNNYFSKKYLIVNSSVEDLSNDIIKNSGDFGSAILADPSQYINGVWLYPISLYNFLNTPTISNIRVGNYTFENYKGYEITGDGNNSIYNFYSLGWRYISNQNLTFLDFTQEVELYLPFIGNIDLDFKEIVGRVVYILYSIDFNTGNLAYYIQVSNDIYNTIEEASSEATSANPYARTRNIFTKMIQIGVKLCIGSSTQNQAELVSTLNIIGSVGNFFGSVAKGAAQSVVPVIGPAMGVSTAVSGTIQSGMGIANSIIEIMKPHYQRGAMQGGSLTIFACDKYTRFIFKKAKVVNGFNWEDFAKHFGRPLNNLETLGNLRGYTKVDGDTHLEEFATATTTELNLIDGALRSGVIL